ncbi:MAG: hypothetical protein DWI57_02730 [Chloroflexi bacterium]|nr:MAG: hypothetical protein DWI57_02730 [Chloroflexota bacterium]
MAFIKKDFAQLYTRLEREARRRTPQLTDFQEGSVVRSLFESFAVEMAVLYEQMDLVYQAGFIDSAEGASLDRVVAVLGIRRNEPDFATGVVTFTRDAGSYEALTIPIGTLVTTKEDESQQPPKKAYTTVEAARLSIGENSVDVKVQAEARGRQMAADADTVVVMPRPVPGIKVVNNARAIRFLGRDREDDVALRQRAKQALLASGRASHTAIENALLSLPGVRGVRIQEDASRPGVIEIFVDGLTERNREEVRQRIDDVRAAGIYASLEPARPISLTAVLRITLESRIRGEERIAIEQRVGEAVEAFIERLPMGEPLLLSQLTAQVLASKGVTDLADFRIDAQRSLPGLAPETTHYDATTRRIETGLNERFLARQVRVAADIKPLLVDVHARVELPSDPLRGRLAARYRSRLAEAAALPASPGVSAEMRRFYAEAQNAAEALQWGIGLDSWTQDRFLTALRGYFSAVQEANPNGGGWIFSREILAHLQQSAAAERVVQAALQRLQPLLAERLRLFGQTRMIDFPGEALTSRLNEEAMERYQAALAEAQVTQQQALEKAEGEFIEQSAGLNPANADDNQRMAAAQATLRGLQQTANDTFSASEASITASRDAELAAVPAQVVALREQALATLAELNIAEALTQSLAATAAPSLYGFHAHLCAMLYDDGARVDVDQVAANFVERPEAGVLFVYTEQLELVGKMQLILSARATAEEKSRAVASLRQAVEGYLENLRPEEEVDLEQLKRVAASQGQASFAPASLALVIPPAEQATPLPDRRQGQKLAVHFGEKVYLAAEPWFSIEVQQ